MSQLLAIERVEFSDGITVYNFTVANNSNYFVIAEGEFGQTCILVHNAIQCGATIDPRTGEEVGRFIGDPHGNIMIEPFGGKTVPGKNPVDTHTLYPNGSNYQRLNPQGHLPYNPIPHAHGHLQGTGPGMKGQGASLAADAPATVVPRKSTDAHWPIN